MKAEEAKRLKELEVENNRLKKLVADLSLDKAMLEELNKGMAGYPGQARHATGKPLLICNGSSRV